MDSVISAMMKRMSIANDIFSSSFADDGMSLLIESAIRLVNEAINRKNMSKYVHQIVRILNVQTMIAIVIAW